MDRKNHELPPHHETAGPSSSGTNADVKPIFLSHSGSQKTFVEQLFDALTNANQSAFFDKHTLVKGSRFPPRIKESALGCKLGVVVISNEFFMSKWPMIELELLVNQRGSDPMVLPLFYKLQPKDLKSATNLDKWRSTWKENAGEHVDKWEKAVHKLSAINGEVFIEGSSETTYIQKVVGCICNLVPCHVLYDMSWVQGCQRLVEEIEGLFEEVKAGLLEEGKAGCSEKLACVVGLHGIGGLGKTTLCKCMINFFTTQYCGRSCLIEFPSDGDGKKIVQECKRALKKLTNLSIERLSNEADSFDQVIYLMREHVKGYDVFLAIDNVWEDCREEAERLLGVGFSAKSQVLVTSRSERVLQDLLLERTKTSRVAPLPAPDHEEAFQIFQKTFKLGDLRCLVDRNEMDSALERCRFKGTYHSLALKALAQYVQRVCTLEGLENIKYHLPVILEKISSLDLQTVEKVIKLSYDSLQENKKNMFLDIVVLAIVHYAEGYYDYWATTYARAHWWLCVLYKQFHKTNITELMYELASDGLIQIGVAEDGEKTLEVHDLFLDLAQREVASSPRFFINESNRSVRQMDWERLERVVGLRDKDACFFMKPQQEGCPKLQVLLAEGISMRGGICLGHIMPSLCVLVLEDMKVFFTRWRRWFAASRVLELNGLVQLQALQLGCCNFVERIGGLHALHNLQRLHIEGCRHLKNLDGLSGLIQLEALHVGDCGSMKKMQDLRGLTCLERLQLSRNGAMEEVGCLSPALKVVFVEDCGALRKIWNLGGLPRLEHLQLWCNDALKEVGGESLSPSLKRVDIRRCGGGVRRFPSLNHCVHLQTLRIENEPAIVDGLVLEKQANLCHLLLEGGKWSSNRFNEQQWEHLTLLQDLILTGFGSIEKLEVGRLGSLIYVCVEECEALEEIGDVRALDCLETLSIRDCPRLKKVSGLVGKLTHGLQILRLAQCGSLEVSAIPGVSSVKSVESGEISGCGNLKDCKLANLPHLQLTGGGNHFNEQQWEHLTHLKRLSLEGFGSVEKLEPGCFGSLKHLSVEGCNALEEIGDVSALHCLEELQIGSCPRLKKVSGLVGILTQLRSLSLWDCGSLDASTIPCQLLNNIKYGWISGCGNLEDWKTA